MVEVKIGRVTHYFGHIGVAAIELTDGELAAGDTIRIVGHTSNFTEKIGSIQIEHEQVEKAGVGQSVGIKVGHEARANDEVLKVIPE